MTQENAIPVIDVGALFSDDQNALDQLARNIYQVYSTVGFAYIVNHAIPDELVQRVFLASERFHTLPLAKKLKVELSDNHRGFIPINTSTDVNSTLAEVTHPNQSESFMVMREDSPSAIAVMNGDYLAGANQWPDLPGFREDVMDYNSALTALSQKLVTVVFRALGAESELMNVFCPPTTWLRLLHYPSFEVDPAVSVDDLAQAGVYGAAPHTDFGCLTLLAQDDVGGLQVLSTEGDWIDVPRVPSAFVVNVGDMLHRWSNGLLRSTPHRVINTSGKARYSCPFFFDPNVTATITPLRSCVSESRVAAYDSINFGDFLRSELEAGYDQHQNTE